jgi:ribosomal protein L12E/L44/L45/RPP1/RPP2
VQETAEAWYFTHWFIDLETNVATPKQWREGKRSKVDGNMDEERKNAIRFGRGQSKNIRNAILSNMPKWLVNKAIAEAKGGVLAKIERFIESKSLAAAQKYVVDQLARVGVTVEQILAKTMRDKVEGLDIDDIVALSGDLKSIESGSENAAALFPAGRAEPQKMDLKDKLKAQVQSSPKADQKYTISVKPGKQPFTYYTNDGMGEYLTTVDGDTKSCKCGNEVPCVHIAAVEAHYYAKQLFPA